jgi:holo-[acyl-carrier protein] synthase
MVKGIGMDIIEVDRIRTVIEKWSDRFFNRIYTDLEIEYCKRKRDYVRSFAARFAAKEATMKALGTGRSYGVRWKDIEVYNAPSGKPMLNFYGRAKEVLEELGAGSAMITLSHSRDYALSQVLIL